MSDNRSSRSRLLLAFSEDSSFRSAAWTHGIGRLDLKRAGLTGPRAVALRKAAIAALPPRMVAAIRRTRGTSDYAGTIDAALAWLRLQAQKGTRLATRMNRPASESPRVQRVRAVFATLS